MLIVVTLKFIRYLGLPIVQVVKVLVYFTPCCAHCLVFTRNGTVLIANILIVKSDFSRLVV